VLANYITDKLLGKRWYWPLRCPHTVVSKGTSLIILLLEWPSYTCGYILEKANKWEELPAMLFENPCPSYPVYIEKKHKSSTQGIFYVHAERKWIHTGVIVSLWRLRTKIILYYLSCRSFLTLIPFLQKFLLLFGNQQKFKNQMLLSISRGTDSHTIYSDGASYSASWQNKDRKFWLLNGNQIVLKNNYLHPPLKIMWCWHSFKHNTALMLISTIEIHLKYSSVLALEQLQRIVTSSEEVTKELASFHHKSLISSHTNDHYKKSFSVSHSRKTMT
jgi:hypothetical protein